MRQAAASAGRLRPFALLHAARPRKLDSRDRHASDVIPMTRLPLRHASPIATRSRAGFGMGMRWGSTIGIDDAVHLKLQ
jgi:hypothetical protein